MPLQRDQIQSRASTQSNQHALTFYAMTMPGLETVAFSEIRQQVPDATLRKFMRGIVLFRAALPPHKLLQLRTVEDIFLTLAHLTGLGRGQDALRVLHSATLHADLHTALHTWQRVHREERALSWRVISQKQGTHDFRRIDAGNTVSDALRHALPRGLRAAPDDTDLEFWLWLNGSEALLGLRLSNATMRHRSYKLEHTPASLRPTVAATMGLLSEPSARDRVLDPLCGAGTLLIERALLGPSQAISGGDIRASVVEMARRNAMSASVQADLQVWDARALPLDSGSATHILTNLPFGKQLGTHESNIALYTALAPEFARVLAPHGTLVALTSEDRLWETTLRQQGWQVRKKVICVVLGQPASIFVAHKT